jgi:hypothetical protein
MLGGAWLSHLAVKWLAVWTKKNYLSKLLRSTQAAFSPLLILPKFQG